MVKGFHVSKLLLQPEVYQKHAVVLHHEIVRLDVPMHVALGVQVFYPVEHLVLQHERRFQREVGFPILVEQVFKRLSEEFHYHAIQHRVALHLLQLLLLLSLMLLGLVILAPSILLLLSLSSLLGFLLAFLQ